jgi:hypothetical protein
MARSQAIHPDRRLTRQRRHSCLRIPFQNKNIMTIQFSQIPVGARFEFRGHRYEKLALSMACDEERLGNIFHAETEVMAEAWHPAPKEIVSSSRGARGTSRPGLPGPDSPQPRKALRPPHFFSR